MFEFIKSLFRTNPPLDKEWIERPNGLKSHIKQRFQIPTEPVSNLVPLQSKSKRLKRTNN